MYILILPSHFQPSLTKIGIGVPTHHLFLLECSPPCFPSSVWILWWVCTTAPRAWQTCGYGTHFQPSMCTADMFSFDASTCILSRRPSG